MVIPIRDGADCLNTGAFIGAVLYMVRENRLSTVSLDFWQFGLGLGLVLVAVVLLVRRPRWDWVGW